MDINDLIILGKTSIYSATGALFGSLLGCYTCQISPQRNWKSAGIWGSIGAFLGTHYYIMKYYPRRYE